MAISVILNLIFIILFIKSFLPLKKNKLLIVLFVVNFLIQYLLNINGMDSVSRLIILILNMIFVQCIFQGYPLKKLSFLIIAYFILAISEYLPMKLFETYGLLDDTRYISRYIYFQIVILTQLFAYSIALLISKLLDTNEITKIFYFSLIPTLLTMVFILFINLKNIFSFNYSLILLILFIISLFFLFYQHYLITKINARKELEIAKTKQDILASKYKLLRENYEETFIFLHRLMHSCNNLNVYLKNKDYNALDKEIQNLFKSVHQNFSAICANHPILSWLLNERKRIIDENRIVVSTTMKDSILCSISLYDQLEFFSELLDIVLECCIKYKGDAKYIVFKSLDSEKQTILQIIFPSNNNIVDNKKYDSFEEKYRVAYGMEMHNIYDITRNKNDLIIIVSK